MQGGDVVTLCVHVYLFCTNMLIYDSQRFLILQEDRCITSRAKHRLIFLFPARFHQHHRSR